MRFLLDSQCLYAAAFAPTELSKPAQAALSDPHNDCFVSPVSLYELELKKALGKLAYPDIPDWTALLARNAYEVLPLTIGHSVHAARLPMHHRDPWDRLLIAQALMEALVLIGGDSKFAAYGVPVAW